jgi:hypothetical protein
MVAPPGSMIAELGLEDATAPARALKQAEQAQTGHQKGETGRLRDGWDWLNFRTTGKETNGAVPQGVSKGVARIKTGIERCTAEAGARAARKASATTANECAATAATAEPPVSVVSKIGAAFPSRCAVDKRAAAETTTTTAARQVSGVSAAATASTTQPGDSACITAIKSGHSAAAATTRDYQRRVVWSNHK